jgi:hypothetical protein
MVLIILGIILAGVGFIGALYNVTSGGARMLRGGLDGDLEESFGSFSQTFKRQAIWGALLVVGIVLALIGVVLVAA